MKQRKRWDRNSKALCLLVALIMVCGTVYVTNATEGNGLDVSAALYKKGEDVKVSDVTFTNTYEEEPPAVKTGDESNISLYIALILVSGALMFVIARRQKQ